MSPTFNVFNNVPSLSTPAEAASWKQNGLGYHYQFQSQYTDMYSVAFPWHAVTLRSKVKVTQLSSVLPAWLYTSKWRCSFSSFLLFQYFHYQNTVAQVAKLQSHKMTSLLLIPWTWWTNITIQESRIQSSN